MKSINIFVYLLILLIAIIIVVYPKLDKKHKFRLDMVCNGLLNKFLILLIIVLITMRDHKIGILCIILFFSVLYQNRDNKEMYEGFISYFEK